MKSKRWGVRVAEPENTVPPAPTAPPLVWHQVGISLLCSWKNRKSLDRLSPSLRHACPQPHHFPWNPLDWDTELGSGSTDCATQGARIEKFSLIYMYQLEKEIATHSSILAQRIPWTEESGGLQSMRLQSQTGLSRHIVVVIGGNKPLSSVVLLPLIQHILNDSLLSIPLPVVLRRQCACLLQTAKEQGYFWIIHC